MCRREIPHATCGTQIPKHSFAEAPRERQIPKHKFTKAIGGKHIPKHKFTKAIGGKHIPKPNFAEAISEKQVFAHKCREALGGSLILSLSRLRFWRSGSRVWGYLRIVTNVYVTCGGTDRE